MKILTKFLTRKKSKVANLRDSMHRPEPSGINTSHASALRSNFFSKKTKKSDSTVIPVSSTEKLRKFFFGNDFPLLLNSESQVVGSSVTSINVDKTLNVDGNVTVTAQAPVGEPLNQHFNLQNLKEGTLILERYRLEALLGKGGMGVVWKARDEKQGVDRAIKFLLNKFHSDILRNEINSCQQLTHPNIVKIFEYRECGGTHFISMEYLDGTPMDRLIACGDITPKQAWEVLEQVCSALSHIHEIGMIHADLKPANIIVTNTGVAKLLDFGIARFEVSKEADSSDDVGSSSKSLNACTLLYASKGVLSGKAPQQSDDLYSLGCIAYELLSCGGHPYGGLNAYQASAQNCKPLQINSISTRQWQTINEALCFERPGGEFSARIFWRKINPHRPQKEEACLFGLLIFCSRYFSIFSNSLSAVA